MKILFLALSFFFTASCLTFAQSTDSLTSSAKKIKHRKNNVKINLTSFLLYRPGIIATYERVINKGQTASIIGGYVETPTLLDLNSENLHLKDNLTKSGYMFGAEYRFYLKSENKFTPPHGVYLGPFLTYYHFHNDRKVNLKTDASNTDLTLKTNFNITNLGLQVGYQFVIAKRVSIDLVMFGPALSLYQFDIQLEGSSTAGDLTQEQQNIMDHIADKAPVLGDFLSGQKLSKDGRTDILAGGFRYAIQVGFCF